MQAAVRPIDREAAGQELARAHQLAIWRGSDAQLVAAKLAAAKEHGMHLLYQLFKHGRSGGKLSALQEAAESHMSAGDAEELRRRYETLFGNTEKLLNRVRQHEEGEQGGVGAQEWLDLLTALENSMHSMGDFIRRMEVAIGKEGLPITHADFMKLMHGLELEGESAAPVGVRPLHKLRADSEVVAASLRRMQGGDAAYDAVRNWEPDQLMSSLRRHWDQEFATALASQGSSNALDDLPRYW